jgi:hypothetical protein
MGDISQSMLPGPFHLYAGLSYKPGMEGTAGIETSGLGPGAGTHSNYGQHSQYTSSGD